MIEDYDEFQDLPVRKDKWRELVDFHVAELDTKTAALQQEMANLEGE